MPAGRWPVDPDYERAMDRAVRAPATPLARRLHAARRPTRACGCVQNAVHACPSCRLEEEGRVQVVIAAMASHTRDTERRLKEVVV